MSEERWDVPSPKLARVATAAAHPQARGCPSCLHRHAVGELCAYPAERTGAACRCSS